MMCPTWDLLIDLDDDELLWIIIMRPDEKMLELGIGCL